jgi:hypothetical protein
VKPCNVGGIQYVMKYMRKPCYVPKGQNETFYLSSRRPGIAVVRFSHSYGLRPKLASLALRFTSQVYIGYAYYHHAWLSKR